MEAPRCIVCNTRHWSTQPCPAFADVIAEERKQQIARHAVAKTVTENPPPVTKKVTINTPVTENVTGNNPISVTPKRGRPPSPNPLSNAERQRRFRQRHSTTVASSL